MIPLKRCCRTFDPELPAPSSELESPLRTAAVAQIMRVFKSDKSYLEIRAEKLYSVSNRTR